MSKDIVAAAHAWRAAHPSDAANLFASSKALWWIAGGWALDLFRGTPIRPHADLDIGVFRRDVSIVLHSISTWEVFEAEQGRLTRLPAGRAPRLDVHSLWCRPTAADPWTIELMLEQADGDAWAYRRQPTIWRPILTIVRQSPDALHVGFVVIPVPIPRDHLGSLADAYDEAIAAADPADVGIGRTTTRVHDFVNRPAFASLNVHPPVLKACESIIKQPFRLSQMAARTLRAGPPAQDLHVDYQCDAAGWTMLGFIFMVDDFRPEFVPGSHRSSELAGSVDLGADHEHQVLACGPADSMIVYNGSVWHGHMANRSALPRRSIQGAYIRRDATSGIDLRSRMCRETASRLGATAKHVLGI